MEEEVFGYTVARCASGDVLLGLQDSQEALIDLLLAILLNAAQLKGRGSHLSGLNGAGGAELKAILLQESTKIGLASFILGARFIKLRLF
jgi:hypothetical protein